MKRSHSNAQFAIWIPFIFCFFNIFPEMCSLHHAATLVSSVNVVITSTKRIPPVSITELICFSVVSSLV